MLGKLLKYELKFYRNSFLLMHAVLLAIAAGSRFSVERMMAELEGYSGVGMVTVLMLFTYLIAILAVNVLGIVLIVRRFYSNLFGSEGYLSFTLPVTAVQHFAGKVISAVLWIIASGLVQALSVLILFSGLIEPEPFEYYYEILGEVFSELLSQGDLVWQILSGIGNFLAGLMMIYFAICLGQLAKKHRILSSIIAYFGLSFLFSMLNSLLTDLFITINPYSHHAWITYETGYYVMIAFLLVLRLAMFSVGSVLIMEKRLNLE